MDSYDLYVDGSLKQNEQRQMAFSYVLYKNTDHSTIIDADTLYANASHPLRNTVNTAELLAFISGVRSLITLNIDKATVYSDSMFVINSVKNKLNTRKHHLIDLVNNARDLYLKIPHLSLQYIPSKENKAHRLCKR